MATIPVAPARTTWADARYPYLVIRVMAGVFSLRPLPSDLERDVLIALGWSVMDAFERRFRMCLRSEEHTSELQSRPHLVCRLLLEKKKTRQTKAHPVYICASLQ